MAVRAVKGTLFSTVAQERDTVVRPHGTREVGGEPREYDWVLGAGPFSGTREEGAHL